MQQPNLISSKPIGLRMYSVQLCNIATMKLPQPGQDTAPLGAGDSV